MTKIYRPIVLNCRTYRYRSIRRRILTCARIACVLGIPYGL